MLYVLSKCWLLSLYLVHTKYILTKFGWTKYGTDQIWLDQIWHRPNLVGPKMAPTKYGFGPNMGWTKYGPDQICWTKFGPTKNGRPKVSWPNLAWHRISILKMHNIWYKCLSILLTLIKFISLLKGVWESIIKSMQ